MLIILSTNSKKGMGKYNNDIVNYTSNFCYVMDGATSLFNDNIFFETSDLYEYMQLLKSNIVYSKSIQNSLINGIILSNKLLTGIDKYEEYKLPTFTIAAISEEKEYYNLYILCDCLISILFKNGNIENIEDYRFDETKIKYRKETSAIDKLELSMNEKLKLKKTIWREYRKLANTKDGYPVGSTNPNSINEGMFKRIYKKDVDKIIICTDGFYNTLGIPNNKESFEKDLLENRILNLDNNDDLTYVLIENKGINLNE